MSRARARQLSTQAQWLAVEGKLDAAFDMAGQALQMAPDEPEVKLHLGLIQLDRGMALAAAGHLEELRKRDATNAAYPVFLSMALVDLDELEKATAQVKDALRAAPDNLVAQNMQAVIALRANEPQQALQILDRAGIEATPRLLGRLLVEVEKTLHRLGANDGPGMAPPAPPPPPDDTDTAPTLSGEPEPTTPTPPPAEPAPAAASSAEPEPTTPAPPPAEPAPTLSAEPEPTTPAPTLSAEPEPTTPAPPPAEPAPTLSAEPEPTTPAPTLSAEPEPTTPAPPPAAPAPASSAEPEPPTPAPPPAEPATIPTVPAAAEASAAPAVEPAVPPTPPLSLGDQFAHHLVDPLVAQVMIGQAERALMRQDPAEAARLAAEAVRRYPAVPRGWCMLGVARMHNKQFDEALAAINSGLAQDGDTPDLLYALGCCRHEMGDRAGAREALNKMLAGFSKDAAAIYTLGQIDLEEGDDLSARRHLERAAFLDFLLIRERFDRLRKAINTAQAARDEKYFPPTR